MNDPYLIWVQGAVRNWIEARLFYRFYRIIEYSHYFEEEKNLVLFVKWKLIIYYVFYNYIMPQNIKFVTPHKTKFKKMNSLQSSKRESTICYVMEYDNFDFLWYSPCKNIVISASEYIGLTRHARFLSWVTRSEVKATKTFV